MVSGVEYNPLFDVEVGAGHRDMTMPLWTRGDKEVFCASLPIPGILSSTSYLAETAFPQWRTTMRAADDQFFRYLAG